MKVRCLTTILAGLLALSAHGQEDEERNVLVAPTLEARLPQDKDQAERLLGAPIVAPVKTEPVPTLDGTTKNGKTAAKSTKARKAS